MPGLIPLMLNPVVVGNRSNVIFAPLDQAASHYSRGQSRGHLPPRVRSPLSPSLPPNTLTITPQKASFPNPSKPKPSKRLSLSSPSNQDWKRAIFEVKRQHAHRRYRACFTRCNEILVNAKDVSDVEPAYLISLHFYAATAMEVCARPLSSPSAYRARLLQEAREHYGQASHLIHDAEVLVQSRVRASFTLPPLSNLHSPSSSISSRVWTSETGFSSPTPSVTYSEDLNAGLHQLEFSLPPSLSFSLGPARKKVSFELPGKDTPIFEPYIRPDSPTLGFDEYFVTGLARQNLPETPSCSKKSIPTLQRANNEDATPRASKNFNHLSHGVLDLEAGFNGRSCKLDNSASRYCAHLANLKCRLEQHKANLEAVIETPPTGDNDIAENINLVPPGEVAHGLDRKTRIERLRKQGWQRKRFDPSRYEALRNAALAELI
ncbi:uncharacterized protein SPSK_09219 [Sporothrix schenckii 1099-18]|uniref:Uncharacterized protein n=1 Tax=Sporothrix schenckii 1099-18 TaxID=1397361 RepID=A0A0F2M7S8_SPOSC|nr:uncharacterized protein SPSK_09219 [Sporothrix schenckii 1099-18]KJR84880.1 hypothetical protein SPSK_09219 [Sporothrix schenckii 1099-18]